MHRLLIVDDEPMMCELIRRLLLPLHNVEVAGVCGDGQDAAIQFKKLKPDIVITDIRMPNMDGLSLLHEIRKLSQDAVVIIISAYDQFEYARQALCEGAFDFLLKPINELKLRQTVESAQQYLNEKNRAKKEQIKIKSELNKLQDEFITMHNQKLMKDEFSKLSPHILSAIRYIHENYAENISLVSVADHIFLNPSYFSWLFKEEIGQGFTKYLTNLRIEKAQTLLKVQTLKINEISHMIGFRDVSYFVRTFKEVIHCTPQEYRIQMIPKGKRKKKHEDAVP